jgi:uncharacterized membrane protein YhaH (DUF805 family)
MSTTLFKIVFEGQLRNGVELQTAKLNLAHLFKSEVAAVEKLFSGNEVVLKRGLSQADAQVYLNALNDAGLEARIEADPAISLNIHEVEETSALYTSQPPPTSPYAPPRASVIDTLPEHSTLKVFSFQGRIGRVRYLAWTLVLMASLLMVISLCVSVMVSSLVGGGLLIAVAVAAFVLVSFQIGVQRLHDAGWSGWLLLLSLVPYIGALFPLLMMIIPGNKNANRYGPPAPPNSRSVKILAWLWILFLCLFIAAGMTGGLSKLHREIESSTVQYEQSLPDDDALNGQPNDSTANSQLEDEDDQ